MSLITPSPGARGLAARLTWGVLESTSLTSADRALAGAGLGGVVLFSRNVQSPQQLRRLICDLRAAAPGPIHVAIDQEGGHVVRIREPLTRFPSAMAIAATGSVRLARAVAAASARELATLGIDVVLAPDLDVALDASNPTLGARTFGSDPAEVARFGAAMVDGYLAGGVLPVAKHVPGHGRTPIDSHRALPVVRGSRRQLSAVELPPFEAAIAAGVPALMTAHVVYAAVDPRPASISPRLIAGIIRGALGFDGLLVTDALVMDAIARDLAVEEATIAAIEAGADAAMVLDPAPRAIAALARAIDDGRLERRRLRAALRRSDAFAARARLWVGDDAVPGEGGLEPAWQLHQGLAREVADQSLTLVRDEGVLPLDPGARLLLVDLGSAATSPVEDAERVAGETGLGRALRAVLPRLDAIAVDGREPSALPAALAEAAAADVVVLATRDAYLSRAQRRAVADILALGRPVVHLALRAPADLALGHPAVVRAAVAAYADVPATCDALAAALVRGARAFPGRLPMPLPASGTLDEPDPLPVAAA